MQKPNGVYIAGDISLNETFWKSVQIPLYYPRVQFAWSWTSDKSIPEPMISKCTDANRRRQATLSQDYWMFCIYTDNINDVFMSSMMKLICSKFGGDVLG